MFTANLVYLSGRVGSEPTFTPLSNGRRMVALSIASETNWKDRNGKWHTDTDWHRVCSFMPTVVEGLARFGKLTGRLVYVQGELRKRRFEEDGQARYVVEIEAGPTGGIAVLPPERTPLAMNTVILSGRLGADAAIKTRPGNGGGKFATLSVGVDRSWQDGSGQWQRNVEWHQVVTTAPGHIDKVLAKDGLKGRVVQVQGCLRAREWTDPKTGEVKNIHQIEADASGTILVVPELHKAKSSMESAS